MSPSAPRTAITRREFLQSAAGAAALAATGSAAAASAGPAPARAASSGGDRKMIVLQLDTIGPADDGVERVLDEAQQRASANVILVDSLWFASDVSPAGLARSSTRGHVRDPQSKLLGGRMGFMRPEYYRETGLDLQTLAPARGVPDILAELSAGARKRGMRVIAIIKDDPPRVAGHERMLEYDFDGQRANTSCKNNPLYRRLLTGTMEDLIRSYDVDGIMYMAERQGPFSDTLGLRFRGKERGRPGSRTCFCPHCRETAQQRGINFVRAREGFEELAKFTAEGRAGRRPRDGYYVTLWRLMLRHPELLAWEHMWHDNLRAVYRLLHQTIKDVRATVLYGMHVWPNISMNPLLSAEHDFAELGQYHDFIKMSVYSNAGGPRMASYVESVGETMFGDLPPEEVLEFHYRVLNYDEAPWSRVRQTGLKNDFVYRQSKRAIDGARGTKAKILPGLDVDIPVMRLDMGAAPLSEAPATTRAGVKDIVMQAFRAGAPGIVISREYTEMKLDNLSGVGDALRELGIKT
jgi:hypothetical protein